jgi:2-keto-4-pentenoate hydratase/2-oxohepta-3-ene-1,7-dioic acid hydratase in catechol pathway
VVVKFVSFQVGGRPSWGLVRDQAIVDLGSHFPQHSTLSDFIASPDFANRDAVVARLEPSIDLSAVRFDPVIPRPEKIICLSRNYMDHHKEAVAGGLDRKITDFPPIFLRIWRSVVGHQEPMLLPRVSEQFDWEGELAVVIGCQGRHIPVSEAMNYVAGYACFNEGSVRDFQHHACQITAGKNFNKSGSFGPYLVTPDELPAPPNLDLQTRINDTTVQSSNTSNMIFGIERTISYCSDIFDLVPGDVLAMGTPSGVGWGRSPKVWLKAGDRVDVEIEGVGLLSNHVKAE